MARASMSSKTKQSLLAIIAVLALIRVFVLPFAASQNEDVAELDMLSRQLERAERLLANSEDQQSSEELEAVIRVWQKDFINYSGRNNFRLEAQQKIQTIVEDNNAQINLFDWLTAEMLFEEFLYSHQARLIIEGQLEDVFQSQVDILRSYPSVTVQEQSIQQQRVTGRRAAGDTRVRVNLLVEVKGVAYQN